MLKVIEIEKSQLDELNQIIYKEIDVFNEKVFFMLNLLE